MPWEDTLGLQNSEYRAGKSGQIEGDRQRPKQVGSQFFGTRGLATPLTFSARFSFLDKATRGASGGTAG